MEIDRKNELIHLDDDEVDVLGVDAIWPLSSAEELWEITQSCLERYNELELETLSIDNESERLDESERKARLNKVYYARPPLERMLKVLGAIITPAHTQDLTDDIEHYLRDF